MEQLHFNNLFKVDSKYEVFSGADYRVYKCVAVTERWAILEDKFCKEYILLDGNSTVSDLMKFKPI